MYKNLIKFIKAERTSENSVEVTYQMTDSEIQFMVKWSNIHPGTGEIGAYDMGNDFVCDDYETLERLRAAYSGSEDDEEGDLYLELRDTFDAGDCEMLTVS